ncbi:MULTISPECIES: GntR family transcriptional regulator [unclassified Paenibacillus]|uniref:GntR family transcriptional regulator n=1 Tax=unclassified Paenibacillus TaxID=185978 RepID=UPI00278842D5|nr:MULTISPECIES: GntR family transcriptional regulator [unclassified Paenibacillus]MDQ0900535.1 DNA-binding GntR family transcriptional regulator [Paenibacillus sp. V4I7]MDQ0920959.1 DNA-binding GntR family transcriptional regulator [Paenibacillus sp. V4I5]
MGSKINRVNLTEEIYRIVKEDILSHKLKSGEKINIDQLARALEVSNIPIREALSRLQSEGYLNVIPFKGMFVNMMSVKELDELFEIRLQLEPLAVEKAALLIPDDILERLQETMNSLQTQQSSEATNGLGTIKEMNMSLHGTILAYCENTNLQNLVKGYIEQIQRYLTYIQLHLDINTTNEEWSEHNAILQKLKQRDPKGASDAMSKHISNSRKRTNAHFMKAGSN